MLNYLCFRMGDYKLIVGYAGLYNDWYKPEQLTDYVSDDTLYWNPSQSMVKHCKLQAERIRLYNIEGQLQ